MCGSFTSSRFRGALLSSLIVSASPAFAASTNPDALLSGFLNDVGRCDTFACFNPEESTSLIGGAGETYLQSLFVDFDEVVALLGTGGDDAIVGPGPLAADAGASATGVDLPLIGSDDFDGSVLAEAEAAGIDVLAGNDTIATSDPVASSSTADAVGGSADGNLAGPASADIEVTAAASSRAVVGGDGDDTIINGGALTAAASSDASGASLGVTLEAGVINSAEPGDALAEAGTRSGAAVTVIDAGNGADEIINNGSISGDVDATATAVGITLSAGLSDADDISTGAALSNGSSIATASGVGIDSGAGDDSINNGGPVTLDVDATANGVAVGLEIVGAVSGDSESGGALSDARTEAGASATALAAGSEADTVLNTGPIDVESRSTATGFAGSFSITVSEQGAASSGGGVSDASAEATSVALGIDGGDGDDTITNITGGDPGIHLLADATATGVGVTWTAAGSVTGGAQGGDALSGARTDAEATVTGISGGGGRDTISSASVIDAKAETTATAVSAGYSASVGRAGDIAAGGAVSDASSAASSLAVGIDGGADDDTIGGDLGVSGRVDVEAIATATGVGASFSVAGAVEGNPAAGDALSKARADADATVVAIAGGTGNDVVTSDAAIDGNATATATAVSAGVTVEITKEGDTAGDATGAATSDASSAATARATGIDGGDGDDMVGDEDGITGGIDLLADANAAAVSVSLSIAGSAEGDAASGDALSAARADADAAATGIDGGAGIDTIVSATGIAAASEASATSVGLGTSVSIGSEGSVQAADAVSDTSSLARSASVGLDGGDGDDAITSLATGEDSLNIDATSTATSVATSFTVAGTAKGDATAGNALSQSRTDADAAATGIAGGSGSDTLLSSTGIDASAESDATAVSSAFSVAISVEGDVTAGAGVSDASSLANARATGIDGGAGDDTIGGDAGITGGIDVLADSAATGVSASFSVAGTAEGNAAAGAAMSEARTDAIAEAVGIDGGSGGDTITSATAIDADALTSAVSVAAGVSVEITKAGDAEGEVSGAGALSDASSLAASTAQGIAGGDGDDTITSTAVDEDRIDSYAESTATGVAATVAVSGRLQGDVGTSGALSEASTTARSVAAAIDAGAGADWIDNLTDIVAASDATATGVSVGVFVGITADGDITNTDAEAAGTALSNASSSALATSRGLDAGTGNDEIDNAGDLGVRASTDATGVAVSLSVAGTASGDAAGGAVSDASISSIAEAIGIDGGDGDDSIVNTGNIHLMDTDPDAADDSADATATAVAVSLNVAGSLDGDVSGEAISDASALATADATGIAGGAGTDRIDNEGEIFADVGAETTSVAVSVDVTVSKDGDVSGAALSDSSANAMARASGIDGGGEDDMIENRADIDIATGAESDSVSVSVSLAGSMNGAASGQAVADASAESLARSVGIAGGDGNDGIDNAAENVEVNTRLIRTAAVSDATSTAVSVSGAGSIGAADATAIADASATGRAISMAISGDAGNDTIDNLSALEAISAAKATARSTTVTATLAVGSGDSVGVGNAGATATSIATGVDGGEGADTIGNAATIFAGGRESLEMAKADAGSTTVTVGVTVGAADNAASASAAAVAEAEASGIDGGAGDDIINNTGAIRAGIAGSPEETTGPLALALAGSQTVDVGVSVGDAFSNASSDSSATALSDIAGIRGAAGLDDIDNSGAIDTFSSAKAVSESTTTKVSLSLGASEGGASSDASTNATAFGAGIDGGDAADSIDTSGNVTVESRAVASTRTNSLNLELVSIGASSQSADANSSATAEAIARGVYGGRGGDTITASGLFDVTADSDVDSTARSSTLGIVSLGDKDMRAASSANTASRSLAVGIDGGEGDDVIDSAALVNVTSVANADSTSKSTVDSGANIAGSTNADVASDARAVATAEGIGIQGGIDVLDADDSDADTITSSNALTVTAEATGNSTSTAEADAITIFGSADAESVADASATVIARGIGIASGADADSITTVVDAAADTSGDIDVTSTASAKVISTATANADTGIGDASTTARSDASVDMLAEALGIDAGSGDDAVSIGSRIGVSAISSGNVESTSVTNAKTVFGDAKSGAVSNASAARRSRAVGIDAGSGDDVIETSLDGVFTVLSTSSGSVTSKSQAKAEASLFGDASSNTVTAAASEGLAEAIGIAGGSGADTVWNAGTMSVDAESELTITSTSVSIAEATFGDAFAGASSDTSIAGRAVAMGISGDDGNDTIVSDGTLSIDGSAFTDVKQVTVALADSTFGSAKTVAGSRNASRAAVEVAGIAGGDGNDTITADGQFAVAGTANVSVNQLTVSSSGPASSDAETLTVANVTGIDGGDGDDSVAVNGAMLVAAAPHVGVANRTYGKGDKVEGNVGIALRANASGVATGAGQDAVTVRDGGEVLVVVGRQDDGSSITSGTEAGADSMIDAALVGTEPAALEGKWLRIDPAGEAAFFTRIVAFDSATGEMTLANPIPFDLAASAAYTLFDVDTGDADIESSTLDAGGRVRVNAATVGDVVATGLTGGAGDDTIDNAGDVSVQASNATRAGNVSVGANVQADLSTRSRVLAVGIDGDAPAPSDDVSLDGADTLGNSGMLSVGATSTIDFGAAQVSYFGQSNIDVGGEASAVAIGMNGGGANDSIDNSGDVSVVALGSVRAQDRVTSLFSDIRQQLDFAASSSASGISGGAGDDTLTIAGSVDVAGTAEASVVGATNSQQFFNIFFGIFQLRTANLVDVTLDGTARGFDLGQGSDSVDNAASLTVLARSVPIADDVARAESDADLKESGARATALNTAVATGISGEAGTQDVSNSGTIDVTAESRATSFARAAEVLEADDQSSITGTLPNNRFRDDSVAGTELDFTGKTVRLATSDEGFTRRAASVTAVDGGLGANQFADDTAAGLAAADVVGTRIRFDSDDPDVAAFESVVTRFEIVTIDDVETPVFTLADALPVDADDNPLLAADDPYRLSVLTATVTAFDAVTGTFTLDEGLPADVIGEGYTLSIVTAGQVAGQDTFVDASRIGESAETLENTWITFAGRDGFVSFVEDFDPLTGTFTLRDAIPFELSADDIYELATTRDGASGSTAIARAIGIELAGGNAGVRNAGAIDVSADAFARTRVEAQYGLALSRADGDAEAIGIRTSVGDDVIENAESGSIDVTATVAVSSTSGEQSGMATAIGIDAGEGENRIENSGTIDVHAALLDVEIVGAGTDLPQAGEPGVAPFSVEAWGIRGGEGVDTVVNTGRLGVSAEIAEADADAVASAYGIVTGGGDDTIRQDGILESLVIDNGEVTAGTAIDTGEGDDRLFLGGDSMTTGSVTLGAGDDRLSVTGTPVVADTAGNPFDIVAGDGVDTLQLIGAGSLASVPLDFERAVKSDTGEFSLPSLTTLSHLRIEAGTLSIASDYAFDQQGRYEAVVYTDGSHGLLAVNGSADLGGSLLVELQGDDYISDGSRYSLVSASDAVTGAFAEVQLPQALPLLRFETDQGADRLDVLAVASRFLSVAENGLQQRVAGNLDAIADGSAGTFAKDLGNLQTLSTDFGRAFESFSPDVHQVANEGATKLIQQATALLQSHLRSSRGYYRAGAPATPAFGSLSMFMSSSGYAGVGMLSAPRFAAGAAAVPGAAGQARSQAWVLGMASRGDYDAVDGYTAFEQDTSAYGAGYDFRIGDGLVLGLAGGQAGTDLEMADAFGTGSVDGWFGNAYGTWFSDARYLEWGVTYNRQDIETLRTLQVGTDIRTAASVHDGDAWSLFVGAGQAFRFDRIQLQPYVNLQYFGLSEDGFDETGAGSLNQSILARDTEALFGEAGVSIGRQLTRGRGYLDWNLLLGVNHDFELDDRRIRYSYAGAPDNVLTLDGRDVSGTSAVLGGSLGYFGERIGTSIEYRGRFNSDYDEQALALMFRLRF